MYTCTVFFSVNSVTIPKLTWNACLPRYFIETNWSYNQRANPRHKTRHGKSKIFMLNLSSVKASIFDYAIFLARSIVLKEYYLMMNFEKKSHFTIFKIAVKMQIWWSNPYKMWFFGRLVAQIFFFRKYVPLVVRKLYTKFQQLSLSKAAILEHPFKELNVRKNNSQVS